MSILSKIRKGFFNSQRETEPKLFFYKNRDVKSPSRGTRLSSGIDFYVPEDFGAVGVNPGEQVIIPTGIFVSIDPEWSLIGFNKSGIATKRQMLMGACVIDADYQGEIHINLHNVGGSTQMVLPGEKLAQFVLLRCDLSEPTEVFEKEVLWAHSVSERGDGKFGSTDHK